VSGFHGEKTKNLSKKSLSHVVHRRDVSIVRGTWERAVAQIYWGGKGKRVYPRGMVVNELELHRSVVNDDGGGKPAKNNSIELKRKGGGGKGGSWRS